MAVRTADNNEYMLGIMAFVECDHNSSDIVIVKGGFIDLTGGAYLTPFQARRLASLLLEAATYCEELRNGHN